MVPDTAGAGTGLMRRGAHLERQGPRAAESDTATFQPTERRPNMKSWNGLHMLRDERRPTLPPAFGRETEISGIARVVKPTIRPVTIETNCGCACTRRSSLTQTATFCPVPRSKSSNG